MYDVTPQQGNNGLTVAEFFAGGGLMAVGFKTAGFNIVWANDFDPAQNAKKEQPQVTTYKHNIGNHIVQKDVTELTLDEIPDTDVIAGGPPCQDFSVAGSGAGEDGDKGKLVWTYLNIIKGKQPKAFMFENVKGLIQKKHKHTFDALLEQFDAAGFNVSWKLISAWDYGVAQKRERVFIVGIRKDLGFTFEFPQPAAEDFQTQVLRDVIGDLPEPTTAEKNPSDGGYSSQYLSRDRVVKWENPAHTVLTSSRDISIHPGDGSVTMERVRNHDPEERLPKGYQNVIDGVTRSNYGNGIPINDGSTPAVTLLARYWDKGPPSEVYQPPSNHNEKSFWTPPVGSEYAFGQANRVQSMDQPSNTIPAHHNSGQPQHPTQAPRRFTVRECLRIQSVPDWYVIPEGIKTGAAYRIVGNGVASRVAWYLGKALAEQLNAATEVGEYEQTPLLDSYSF